RERTLERELRPLQRLDGRLRKRVLVLVDRAHPGVDALPVERRTGGLDRADGRRGDLRTDAITFDQADERTLHELSLGCGSTSITSPVTRTRYVARQYSDASAWHPVSVENRHA